MENLAIEIANILNITVEKAIELMPIIREQFIKYSFIDSIANPFSFALIFSSMAMAALSIVYLYSIKYAVYDTEMYGSVYEEEIAFHKNVKKLLIIAVKTVIIIVIVLTVTDVLKYILAPDFMLIKEFIIK